MQKCKTVKTKKIANLSVVSSAYSQAIKPSLPARWLAWPVFFLAQRLCYWYLLLFFVFCLLLICVLPKLLEYLRWKFFTIFFFPTLQCFLLFSLTYLTFPPLCCLCAKKQTFNANLQHSFMRYKNHSIKNRSYSK